MSARTTELAKAAATAIALQVRATATVERCYVPDVDTDALPAGSRRVFVFAPAYTDEGMISRRDQLSSYVINFVVVEKYGDPGAPTNEWLDELVAWTNTNIIQFLGDATKRFAGTAWADSAVVEVYDVDELIERKTFWSNISIIFKDDGSA